MAPAIDALLYLGCALLLGAGTARVLLSPALTEGPLRRRLEAGAWLGAALVVLGSAADVAATLHGVLGYLDAERLQGYATGTRHGRMSLLRLGLVVPLAIWILRALRPAAPRPRPVGALAAGAVALGALATFSATSHAAVTRGAPALLADLAHLTAAVAWPGVLAFLALLSPWHAHRAALAPALRRLSVLGLAAVVTLALSGTYAALLHLQAPARFVASSYGLALGVKLALVAGVVAVAAANRAWLLPAFLRGAAPGRLAVAVRAEAALLLFIFGVTGVLTTRAVPHEPGATPDALENLLGLLRVLSGP